MAKQFFISDLHFGHKKVLSYDNRPFTSIEAHDQELISRWNKAVTNQDEVYILGDISWYSSAKTIEILKRLNGRKHLITGNHDEDLLISSEFRKQFASIHDYYELPLDKYRKIVLCHYPIPCFKKHHRGWIHLYGHVHVSYEANMMEHVKYEMESLYEAPCNMYHVGCMMPYMDYTPRTLDEIIAECGMNQLMGRK